MVSRTTYFSKKVTLLNTAATLLIVLMHAETPIRFGQPFNLQAYPFIYSAVGFARVAVPLFFFISAVLFYRNCEWKDIPGKLYKRLFSLAVPYILWNLIFCIIYFALSRIQFTSSRMSFNTPLDTVKDWIAAIWQSSLTPLWFIKYLIIYCLASPIILLVIKNKWVGLLSIIGLLSASIIFNWSYFDLHYWIPIYMSGAWAGRHLYINGQNENNPILPQNNFVLIVCVTALISLLILSLMDIIPWAFYRFFSPILIWFGVDSIKPEIITDKFKVKEWMGYTFFIYATHHFLLNIEQSAVRATFSPSPVVLNLTFIITPIITIILIVLIARLLSKYRFYKVLTGGR